MKCHFLVYLIPLAMFGADIGATQIRTQPPQTPQIAQTFTAFGTHIGEAGFVPSTAPGLNEIYLDGRSCNCDDSYFWHALRYDVAAESFAQTFSSPIYSEIVRGLDVADVHATPGDEIIVVLEDGELLIYQQLSKDLLYSTSTGVDGVRAFVQRDLDADGLPELLLLSYTGLHILDAAGVELHHYPGLTGTHLAVGQMDSDPSLEIALTDGLVFDYASGTIQCTWPSSFGFEMRLVDADSDGMEEIIFCEDWSHVGAFDVDTCTLKWSMPVGDIDSLTIGDSNQDGALEFILGEGQHGQVRAYDLTFQNEIWSLPNSTHGVTRVSLFDLDADGTMEVLWAGGATSTGEDLLYIGDPIWQTVDWTSVHLTGPFLGPLLGDVDGDGVDDLVFASTESQSQLDGGRIIVRDQLTMVPYISPSHGFNGELRDIELYDLDNDGDMEIIVAAAEYLEAYDFTSNREFVNLWREGLYGQSQFWSVHVADIDQDGRIEIVGGSDGFYGPELIAYDWGTGWEEWDVIVGSNFGRVSAIESGDFDGDGETEILAMVGADGVYMLDSDGVLEQAVLGNYSSLSTSPPNQWTPQGFVASTHDGEVQAYQWNGTALQLLGQAQVSPRAISGFSFSPWSQRRFFAATDGYLGVFHRNSGALLWQSPKIGEGFGNHIVPLPSGGLVTAGPYGIYEIGN